jgi:amidase
MRRRSFFASLGLLASAISTRNASALPSGLAPGDDGLAAPDSTNAVHTSRHYLERIARLDRQGPELRSIIELNPEALKIAAALDAERAAGTLRGPSRCCP